MTGRQGLTTGAHWHNDSKYRIENADGFMRYCDTIRDAKEDVAADGEGYTVRRLERRTRTGWEFYGNIARSSSGSVQWLKP